LGWGGGVKAVRCLWPKHSKTTIETSWASATRATPDPTVGRGPAHCTHPPFWRTKGRAQNEVAIARVGPHWMHHGIPRRPGRGVSWHRKEWWSRVGGWASSPQPRGRCMLFAAGLPPLNDRHASVLALKSTCNEPWPVWANPESGEHAMETGVPELCAPGGVLPQRPLTKPTVSHASPTPPVHALSEKISHAS
jgi:hypothetical protein